MHAGLGVSEFDELLSEELASTDGDVSLDDSGVTLRTGNAHCINAPCRWHSLFGSFPLARVAWACLEQASGVFASMPIGGFKSFLSCAGDPTSHYRQQLEQLRRVLWENALTFVRRRSFGAAPVGDHAD